MAAFTDAIRRLEELGISDVLLPFILIFTIIFAVMQRTKILGENKKFHGMTALVFALAVVIPHVTNSYPNPKYDVVNIINSALPNVSVIVIAIVAVLILLGVFGIKFPIGGNSKSILASVLWILSFGTIIFIFGSSAGWGWWKVPRVFNFLLDKDTQALLLIILVFGLIVAYVMGDDKEKEKGRFTKGWKNFLDDITSEGSGGGSSGAGEKKE